MTCGAVRELLLDYLDAALPGEEREAVAAHLAVCEACRAEEAALRWADRALAPLAAVEGAPPAEPSDQPWLRARRRAWWWTPAAAVAAGALALALALLLPLRRPGPSVSAPGDRRAAVVAPRPAQTRAPELPEPSATGRDGPTVTADAGADAAAAPAVERRRSARRGPGPSGAVEEPVSVAIVIVEPGTAPRLRSSYQAEVALPDGATSSLTQSISRDETGTPREIAIAYAQRATEPRREE